MPSAAQSACTSTCHSLYAAVSVGLETATIIAVLNRLSKVPLPQDIKDFIIASTSNYGKVGSSILCSSVAYTSTNPTHRPCQIIS